MSKTDATFPADWKALTDMVKMAEDSVIFSRRFKNPGIRQAAKLWRAKAKLQLELVFLEKIILDPGCEHVPAARADLARMGLSRDDLICLGLPEPV